MRETSGPMCRLVGAFQDILDIYRLFVKYVVYDKDDTEAHERLRFR
jgi:hypothetical protein